ncbi:MAG: hypothetical protein AAFQ94_14355 [Bacteroidota bacterium]
MARTITEIQQEIERNKNSFTELNELDNSSKASIWRLWTFITASAIWTHEKIVERNSLVSRPHTLSWYREQALNFIYGHPLKWEDGFYRFDTTNLSESEINNRKIIKYCAVGEVDLETIFSTNDQTQTNLDIDRAVSQYFHNQVGIILMKVAGEDASGNIVRIPNGSGADNARDELGPFKEYMRRIKDAGNQIQIISIDGDKLSLTLDVYVDPLQIYINPIDVQQYLDGDQADPDYVYDENNGELIANPGVKPAEEAIFEYMRSLEFNGGFVKAFLIDNIQKADGVRIPVMKDMMTGGAGQELKQLDDAVEFFIPQSGYFDISKLNIDIRYIPYTFYRSSIR